MSATQRSTRNTSTTCGVTCSRATWARGNCCEWWFKTWIEERVYGGEEKKKAVQKEKQEQQTKKQDEKDKNQEKVQKEQELDEFEQVSLASGS